MRTRVFMNKPFERFVRANRIPLQSLCKAVDEIASGTVHADLGGGVFKQRIARQGQGKSGGFRTIVFLRIHEMAFFIFGFAKNAQENLAKDELKALKDLAKEMLHYDEKQITLAVQSGTLIAIDCNASVP